MNHSSCREALHLARMQCDVLPSEEREVCRAELNIHENKLDVDTSFTPTKCIRVGYTQPLWTSVSDGRSNEVVYGLSLHGNPTRIDYDNVKL